MRRVVALVSFALVAWALVWALVWAMLRDVESERPQIPAYCSGPKETRTVEQSYRCAAFALARGCSAGGKESYSRLCCQELQRMAGETGDEAIKSLARMWRLP